MIENKKATRSQKKGAKEILRLGEKALAYRRDILNLNHNKIFSDMKAIWNPNDIWNSFLDLNN